MKPTHYKKFQKYPYEYLIEIHFAKGKQYVVVGDDVPLDIDDLKQEIPSIVAKINASPDYQYRGKLKKAVLKQVWERDPILGKKGEEGRVREDYDINLTS
ncbi:MAG: hypothetical protein QXI58_04690 [Candidatus Micrarchaeia archaeon]